MTIAASSSIPAVQPAQACPTCVTCGPARCCPTNKAIAHHLVVFEVDAAHVAEANAKDQAEAGPQLHLLRRSRVGGADRPLPGPSAAA